MFIHSIHKVVEKILGRELEVIMDKGILVVKKKNRVNGIKYLIADEVEYGFKELDQSTVYKMVESISSLYTKVPVGSEIKIVKLKMDKAKFIRKIENELVNIKAVIERTEEPHIIKKLERKMKLLEQLYYRALKREDIERIILVVKLRGEAASIEELRQFLETQANFVKTVFRFSLGINLRDAGDSDVRKLLKMELGLVSVDESDKAIVIDSSRLATIQPIPYNKTPSFEEVEGVYLGYDIESNWPVVLSRKQLFKHILIVGPTGRGKTVTLATLIENIVSMNVCNYIGVDFKGDLINLLDKTLTNIVRPIDTPINLFIKPPYVSHVDWILMVNEVLKKTLGLESKKATNVLNAIVKKLGEENSSYSIELESILLDPDLSILANVIEIISEKPRYNRLYKLITEENTAFDLREHGVAFQNLYGSMLVSIIANVVTKGVVTNKLVIIDEAWRISRIRSLYTLVKEGRSKNVGVVLATQNIEDVPPEVIDNINTVIAFGSYSDSYLNKLREILGLKKEFIDKMKRLGIGEAILLASNEPHPVYVRIEPPSKLRSKELNARKQ